MPPKRRRRRSGDTGVPAEMPREILDRIDRVREYHASSKHTYDSVRVEQRKVVWPEQPSPFRVFEGHPKVDLPTDLLTADLPALNVLAEGIAGSQHPPHDLRTLASWLKLANGITGERRVGDHTIHLRSCPSSSALFPFEIYVAAFGVEGLGPGFYHYSVREHALRKLREGDETLAQIKKGRPDLEFLKTVPAALLVSTVFCRSAWRYRQRGYRYALIDAGHLVQNLVTAANGLGIQTTTRLSMNSRNARELIGIPPGAPFGEAEAVQAMVVWAEQATSPMKRNGHGAAVVGGTAGSAGTAAPDSADDAAGASRPLAAVDVTAPVSCSLDAAHVTAAPGLFGAVDVATVAIRPPEAVDVAAGTPRPLDGVDVVAGTPYPLDAGDVAAGTPRPSEAVDVPAAVVRPLDGGDRATAASRPHAGGLPPILRAPLAAKEPTPYPSIVATHEDCVAPGVTVRDLRTPLTDLSPMSPHHPPAELPSPGIPAGGPPLWQVMTTRRSARDFVRTSLPLDQFWSLNRLAFRGGSYFPVFPSGPHVGLVRPMWMVNDVEGLEPGVWHYHAADDRWMLHRRGQYRFESQYLCLEQPIGGNAAAAGFLLADLKGLMDRGGPDTYRLAHLEAGVTAQRIFLAAGAMGVGCTGIGPFYDDETVAFLEPTTPGWEAIYAVVVGAAKDDGKA